MLVSLPSGNPQNWGDPTIVNISGAVVPLGVDWYDVRITATIDGSVVYDHSKPPDPEGNITVLLSDFVEVSPGSIGLEFQERYKIGDEVLETWLPDLTQTLEVVNAVVMEVSLPGGLSPKWGDPYVVDITGARLPVDPYEYYAVIRASKMNGAEVESEVLDSWEDSDPEGKVSVDISRGIRSAGVYRLEFGQAYILAMGRDRVIEMFEGLTRMVEFINTTIVDTAEYTLIGGAVQLSGNPIQVNAKTPALLMDGKNNYKRALKVTCPALIGSPLIEEITPKLVGGGYESIFDISGLVDQPAVYGFDYPAVGTICDHRALELNVALDVGEIYIDGNGNRVAHFPEVHPPENSIRVLKGSLRPYELAKLAELGVNFNSEYIEKGRFLTHLPDRMKVSPTQIVKLWYLSRYTDYVQAEWHCHVNLMSNYGPHTYMGLKYDFMLDPNSGLLEFNVNPNFMAGGSSFDGDPYPVYWYSFWLERKSDHTKISEVRTFVVDNDYHEQSHTFYYVNPISGIDCIWLHGEHSESLKTEKDTAYKPVPFGSGTKVGGLKTTSASGKRSWEINTGYKTREEVLGLRDFLESRECWMVDNDQTSRLIPVVVEAGDYLMFNSMPEFVPNLQVKILEAN